MKNLIMMMLLLSMSAAMLSSCTGTGTGTGGYVLEHDILQSSRYWKVNTIRKNSDATNVYNWNKS